MTATRGCKCREAIGHDGNKLCDSNGVEVNQHNCDYVFARNVCADTAEARADHACGKECPDNTSKKKIRAWKNMWDQFYFAEVDKLFSLNGKRIMDDRKLERYMAAREL